MYVHVFQFDPQSRSPRENAGFVARKTSSLKKALVVLPELFLTSYSRPQSFSKKEALQLLSPLQEISKKYSLVYLGSILITGRTKNRNALVCISPKGISFPYTKRALYGTEKIKDLEGKTLWSDTFWGVHVGAQICLDIRNPLWTVQLVRRGVTVLVNPQTVSVDYLHTIAHARSLEHNIIVCTANRCGKEKTGEIYLGKSAIYTQQGNVSAGRGQDMISMLIK